MIAIQFPYWLNKRTRNLMFTSAAAFALWALTLVPAHSQTGTALYSFKDGLDGVLPSAGVIRDQAGNLYGTTWYGGDYDQGSVFKLAPNGVKTTLYSFHGGANGSLPSSLVRDTADNLYGINSATVFKLSPAGKLTVLHRFAGSPNDGLIPTDLIRDGSIFYGTTELGGAANVGTVFKMDAGGNVTLLYSFTGGSGGQDGAGPVAVIRDGAGNFYGATAEGGNGNWGTIFKLDAAGKETILFAFTGGGGTTDGNNPAAGLVIDAEANLYGTTAFGGSEHDAGTLFRVDQHGNETVLHTFYTVPTDGGDPESTLVPDSAGNLYGATAFGGAYGYGTVFKYDTAGNETVLHSFSGFDGQYPLGNLAMDETGNLYGTCQQGGTFGWGTVFVVTP